MVRLLLIAVGVLHLVNGLVMLLAPGLWYTMVPGVIDTGPLNAHFVYDIAMAYAASGAGLLLGARSGRGAALFACAGATWPVLHALVHVAGWSMHGFPSDAQAALAEIVGVIGIAALGALLAWLRLKEEPA